MGIELSECRKGCCIKKCGCKIQINNILICGDKKKTDIHEYSAVDGVIKDLKDNKIYKNDKKGIIIINKLSCKDCCNDCEKDDDFDD